MPQVARLADVVSILDAHYPPGTAESWDAVGLVCGDPAAEVTKVLFAVDPVAVVADEAIAWGAQLIVTHHPLFLRGVTGVAATSPKGRLVHRLISNGVALLTAHTNADAAVGGVNDALAGALGLRELRPLAPLDAPALDKLVTFVPVDETQRVLDALATAGAGAIGDYDRCAWTTVGTGTFRPGPAANPTIGSSGRIEEVAENRLEMVLPRPRRAAVVEALLATHSYEEPAYDVFELAALPSAAGHGRVGVLQEAESLTKFVERVAAALPATTAGVRATGDPAALVRTVAVCGGTGGPLVDDARRAGADVFVTADLRHHPASENSEEGGLALVDVAHWASEWPWLTTAADRLQAALTEGDGAGTTVETRVSTTPTDPWTLHVASAPSSSS